MSSSPPSSPEVSDDTVQETAPFSEDDNGAGEETLTTLVRESADGGSTQSLKSNSQDGGCSDGEREEFQNGSEKEKEKQNVTQDLDKDIDAMVEYNVKNDQVDPNASLSMTNIPVDSALNSTNADDSMNLDGGGADGMEANTELTKFGMELDVNGNQQMEAFSEKSFTSDTSSAVAEAVVKNVLDKAVEAVRSHRVEGMEKEPESEDSDSAEKESNMPIANIGDLKVGLFQYQGFDDDESDKDESVEDDDNNHDDDNDVVTKEPQTDIFEESDVKVGLFQYYDYAETDRVRSPEVSEMEDEVVEDQLDSMTDEEKQSILKLYGLETIDAISPKSASPSEQGATGESMEEKDTENYRILDVQRDVYEPQTRQFSVTRDPSSSESTPRYESIKLDTEVFDENEKLNVEKADHSGNGEHEIGTERADNAIKADEDERKYSADDNGEVHNYDDRILCGSGSGVIQDISPPLIQYESIKDKGKFRIVKTPKEGGGASYSTIRVGADSSSPKQSPSESGSEHSQGHGSGDAKRSPVELSPRSETGSQVEEVERVDKAEWQSTVTDQIDLEKDSGDSLADMIPTHDYSHIDRLRHLAEKENEIVAARTSPKTVSGSLPQVNGISQSQPLSMPQQLNGQRSPKHTISDLHASPRESTHEGQARTYEGQARTHEGQARTYEGQARTHEGQARTHEGQARTHEGQARTHEGQARTYEGEARTNKEQARTQEGHVRTQDRQYDGERTYKERERSQIGQEAAQVGQERPQNGQNRVQNEREKTQAERERTENRRERTRDVPERTRDEMSTSRTKYMTRDIEGRESERTSQVPYTDPLASDSRYLEVQGQEARHNAGTYDRDRYMSESYSKRPDSREDVSQVSQFSPSYREDLIQSAYSRVSYRAGEPVPSLPASRSLDTGSRSMDTRSRSLNTGVIPGFRTLQEQQASWSSQFHTLEDDHRRELRTQYERHQYNIQRLQQQMELELQKQHLAIRKKLDIHKEALVQMSPERENATSARRYRSPDRSLSPDRGQRTPDRSCDRLERSKERSENREDVAALQGAFDSKTWREIYREVRKEEEDKQDPTTPQPLKRSLDSDFATVDSSTERSRLSLNRPSPHGRSAEQVSRSGERERSSERPQDPLYERSTTERIRDTSSDRIQHLEEGRSRSPEGEASRSYDRDSRSRSKRSLREALSPGDGAEINVSMGSGPVRNSNVSPHVQELLDNLNDSRYSLRGIQGDVVSERPRAGVYSSPMPMLRGKGTKATPKPSQDTSVRFDASRELGSGDHSRLPLTGDHAEFHDDRRRSTDDRDRRDRDARRESLRSDDIYLSPSGRINLREKHSKHLADLRAYYEDELRELRKALTDSLESTTVGSADTSMQSTVQNQLLEAENKHLLDKCRTMQDEIDELYSKMRTVEQKNLGLEKRASEYSAAYADSQAMGIQHRAHIEELQRYCRERDDLVNDLESKVRSQEDSVKIYKKNLDDEMELHRQDKIALQRIVSKYDALEREFKLLQETMNSTENKLYETRTEVVELNRTISKLELDNKRLGRENDNLRHKVTQSLNLSTLHESFGSPSSPRGGSAVQSSTIQQRTHAPSFSQPSSVEPRPQSSDGRVPMFSTSMQDWSPTTQKSRPKTTGASKTRSVATEGSQTSGRYDSSDSSDAPRVKKDSKARRKELEESLKGKNSERTSESKPREEASRRSQKHSRESDQEPTRDVTPPRSYSANSQSESEFGDYSPLLKAERELFKLRDMMRQAVAVKPSSSPPQPKLQKKFYGSERPSAKDDYTPDLGTPRGTKEKPGINNHASVAKTKASQSHSKSDKTVEKSSKKSSSNKSEKSSKTKERGSTREQERKDLDRSMERERNQDRTPTKKKCSVNPEVFNSPTRFDIDINEEKKTLTVSQKKAEAQSGKQKNLFASEPDQSRSEEPQTNGKATNGECNGAEGQLQNTLDMMRHGQYTTRPQWEDVFTSLAKPKTEPDKPRNMEEKIKDRLRSISEMENRYDGLQAEKRQLESSITKIPLHGRVDRNNRRHKEELEDRLDIVEKELGSLRMSLKRYNVLKTAG